MIAPKPVVVQRFAFDFCRVSLAVVLWLALALRLPWLVVACAAVLAVSAIVTVRWAPMVVLYRFTLGLAWPGGHVVLDERGMRFAHGLGALMASGCAALLYTRPRSGYLFLFFLAIFKTAGAIGFCSALKLYGCLNSDTCCSMLARPRG